MNRNLFDWFWWIITARTSKKKILSFELKGVFNSETKTFTFQEFGDSPVLQTFQGQLKRLEKNEFYTHTHVGGIFPIPSRTDFESARKINRLFSMFGNYKINFVMLNIKKVIPVLYKTNVFVVVCDIVFYNDAGIVERQKDERVLFVYAGAQ